MFAPTSAPTSAPMFAPMFAPIFAVPTLSAPALLRAGVVE